MRAWPVSIAIAVAVASAPPAAAAPAWSSRVEAAVDAALAPHLSAPERRRLLARGDVRRALTGAMDGWDGDADTLAATIRADGAVTLRIVVRERRRECDVVLAHPERPAATPECRDVVDARPETEIVLEPPLWKAPRTTPPKPPKPPPPEPPEPPPAEPPDPGPPLHLIVPSGASFSARAFEASEYHVARSPAVYDALVAYATFQDELTRPGRRDDPFLPDDRVMAATAMEPAPAPSPTLEGNAIAGMRNPFGPGRMQTDLPVPDMVTLSHEGKEPDLVPPASEECLARWRMRESADVPPELECFKRAAHNIRLNRDLPIYETLQDISKLVGFGFSLPGLDLIIAQAKRDAASHQAFHAIWAAVWLEWVEAHPDRLVAALEALSERERKTLRRRLWRWWVRPEMARWRPLVTRIYERHFVRLYPEARDHTGLPRAAFFQDTWLWASNWLSELERRPSATIVGAYERLAHREQAVIDGFVADDAIAARFAQTCDALRARAN